ncbi:hypothetical protein VF14_34510 [Nostoc linckia z18]|uniref:Uncharacterized protein n=2 Tax=Nostoc linckia TaxID=92942 RepID=A0A9Q5Z4Q7_NOSLI|nr:hypothetical protein [Nostoc linckia]PHJ54829.1 hypothetical protein VF02_36465 [Nostoc linckia z1]PHJ56474.1 hypothetical protein VF05_37195 [Nostoc linckia z3]PHJ64504.1 hypothetical protein VF03_28855 [Nostoc linckia z2]PHJ74090.1 hypothetical protein VF06_35435 [Nostoc linckia z4]PHJ75974.1 hypothetical protein VF07_37110 [Nostoc linckia z6]PHJ86320.1 hypothetical protein VF04_35325 [Nostoc linckia z7]PHJ93105.1 hypothetical protein VF08_35910 [Nostoc linckia z8]PHK00220.1 hypothetic
MQLRLSNITKYSALFPSPWHTIDSGLPSSGSSGLGYFPNLYPEDIPNYIRRNQLFFDGNKWRYQTLHKKIFTPNGEYNFVVQGGQIYIARQKFALGSHIDIARGNNVDFAGQIRFGHNKNNKGQIKYWNNLSGHYKPSANFASNAGLPLYLFRAYHF